MLPDDIHPTEFITNDPPIEPPIFREDGSFMSFADVEERLVLAMLTAWRLPDRERGWLSVKAYWPDVMEDQNVGDQGNSLDGARIRPAALTRRDIGEMEEAFSWLAIVALRDRKLIGLAISALARGEARIPWMRLLKPMGLKRGSHGLRKRYGRALNAICIAINGRNAPRALDQSPLSSSDKI